MAFGMLICLVFALAFLVVLLAIRRQAPRPGQVRYPGVMIAFFGAMAAAVLFMIGTVAAGRVYIPWLAGRLLLLVTLALTIASTFGMWLYRLDYDVEGIDYRSFYGTRRYVPWSAVRQIRRSAVDRTTIVLHTDCGRVTLSDPFVTGTRELLHMAAQMAPACEISAELRRMYDIPPKEERYV